jgi:hypothetical protein
MASAGRDRILAVSMDICSANIQALPSILVPWPSLSFAVAPQQSFDSAADDDDAVVPSCPAWALRIATAAAFVADTSLRVVVVLLLFVWFWSDMDAHNGKCRAAAVMCAAPLELEITTVLAFACGGQVCWLSFWSVLLFRVAADAPRLDARWSWWDPAALATATAPVPTTAADSFAPLLLVERTEEPTIAAAAVVVAAATRLCEPWSIWAVVFDSETKFAVVVAVVVVAAVVVLVVVVEMPFLLYVRSNQAFALA